MDKQLFYGDIVNTNRIIYTPSDFAKTNLLHLQEVGITQARQPHKSTKGQLSSYLFFLVQGGSGTLEYEGVTHQLTKGDCVFLDCRKEYSHCSSLDLWQLQWVHFYGPNIQGIHKKYLERGGLPCFHTKNYETYEKLLAEIYSMAGSNEYIRDMNIYSMLAELLTLLMSESWHEAKSGKTNTNKQNLQAVKEYLDENYKNKITLDELAELFYINKYYLTRIFKEQFGISVIDYLLHIRITQAKQLLRFSEYNIEEVGIRCGIPDANYFTRTFKKIEGISPKEYRKLW